MFCLFLASSFMGIFAQNNVLQQQQIQQEEQKVAAYIAENLKKVLPENVKQNFIKGFNHSEGQLKFNQLSVEEQKLQIQFFREAYLRYEYFQKNPKAWIPYQAEMAPICLNGSFEDGNFNNYQGQTAFGFPTGGNPAGYIGSGGGECNAIPTMGFGNFGWTPNNLFTTSVDNFDIVSAGNDPIVASGGDTLSMINPNSPLDNDNDPMTSNQFAARINSPKPLVNPTSTLGVCRPDHGINRLIKPITLDESGIQTVRFYYALVSEFPNHNNANPIFVARALDGNNAELDRLCVISNPAGNPFFNQLDGLTNDGCPLAPVLWQDWTCAELKVSGNAGDVINLEFIMADCGAGAHFGYAYIDDICAEECVPGSNFQGNIRLNEFDPCEVTLPFDVCADFTLPELNGETGTLTANNTSLDILQNGQVVQTLTNGVITGNTVCFTVNPADFPGQSGGYDFQVNAIFGIAGETQNADDVHTIPGQNNDYIFNNPDCCDIAATISNIVCYDQGSTDPSDDTWTFDLTVTNSAGSTWTATTPNGDSGGYGNPTTIDMGDISANSGIYTFSVFDDADPSCTTDVSIEVPKPCSPPCDLEYTFTVGECNDNGTPSDYSDDFYYVTVTVTGTNGLPWMAKQKLESNNAEFVLDNVTGDVTDYQLGPIDVSDGDWTLWIGLTDYSDCLKDEFIHVPDCCTDDPYISPYWDHPNCPEVVCTADQWPIHVLSSDGSTIENGNGITIVWDNLDTAVDENDIQDWIYVSALENWQATITYPNGCEYVITYLEDCCDEDIYINAIECPTTAQLQAYQTSLEKAMAAAVATQSASAENDAQSSAQAQIQAELDRLRAYMELRASSGDDCDPCILGSILIELVDVNGDPIDIDDYDTFSWDHNGSQATNVLVDLPMENGPICFTATNTEYGKECVYQDCFFYECEEECVCDDLVLGDLNVSQVNECLYSIGASSSVNCFPDQIVDEVYSFTINNDPPITSSGNGIYHTFTANGMYDITMTWTITDVEGCETTVSISETVKIECVDDPDPCVEATNLRFDCRRASMSWTGDPLQAYVVEVTWDDPYCRDCKGTRPTQMRWDVQGTSFSLPYIDRSGCFSWRVGTKCKDGTVLWSASQCVSCYTRPHEPTPSDVKTVAKISPNPNDGNMNIEISGANKTNFDIKVYRFDGILIKSFDKNHIENNLTTITWNGKSVLTPGIYFLVITTDTETITKKVIIK